MMRFLMSNDYISYKPDDSFLFNDKEVCTVLDFWSFSYGNLAGQSPVIAEFLVAKALGKEKPENVTYWTAYDMEYRGKRIEVKSTEYVHSWNKRNVSETRTFSIAPSNIGYWNNTSETALERQNDIYVFCVNVNREVGNPQPLKLDFWEFYVISTKDINKYAEKNGNPSQKKITLGTVKKLAGAPADFDGLKKEIDSIIDNIYNTPFL